MKLLKTKSGYLIIRILSGRSNVFVLTNGAQNILVDTSTRRNRGKLQKQLAALGVGRIDCLVLTHAHFDHAGNARKIKDVYGAMVMVHQHEAPYLIAGDNIPIRGTNRLTRPLAHIFGALFAKQCRYDACPCDIMVHSAFDLREFGFNAYVMHTPGHTPGSISIVVDDEIAIVGDTMFGVFKRSVFPPFAQDVEQMVHSWGELLKTNCSLFLPSHGAAKSRDEVMGEYERRRIGE